MHTVRFARRLYQQDGAESSSRAKRGCRAKRGIYSTWAKLVLAYSYVSAAAHADGLQTQAACVHNLWLIMRNCGGRRDACAVCSARRLCRLRCWLHGLLQGLLLGPAAGSALIDHARGCVRAPGGPEGWQAMLLEAHGAVRLLQLLRLLRLLA